MTRQVILVIHPGFHLLDATGPVTAFDLARLYEPQAYDIQIMAAGGGSIVSSAGIAFGARPLGEGPFDTIIVAGGAFIEDMSAMTEVVAWLRQEAPRARRMASVSTGAFLLAEAGLLDGRHATTHWSVTHLFSRRFPEVALDADRIYIRDGAIWTSGGATAGIDLTLALIEDDLGPATARGIAQLLVVHQRRPGGQSQHSGLLELGGVSGRFADLMDWIRAHLAEPLSIERLAARAAMSPRHFARTFTQEVGLTPAKAVEKLRIDMARAKVEGSYLPLDEVAEQCGFGDTERMRRAFLRNLGLPPQVLRQSARTTNN
jgi:transcriptional regulator GlxA family with amidase domain